MKSKADACREKRTLVIRQPQTTHMKEECKKCKAKKIAVDFGADPWTQDVGVEIYSQLASG